MAIPNLFSRILILLGALALLLAGRQALGADGGAFDLDGPALRIAVTHRGTTLPLSQVPNLSPGDALRVEARLPADQGARFRMVLAFLRGATNPPPEDWLVEARTWKPKDAVIEARVPEGAQQALVFLVPDTGGAFDAIEAAVRQRPGAFVRASQDLNQAMLDRTRLEAFLAGIRQLSTDEVARVSPVLAETLAVKVDPACLERRQGAGAACAGEGQNAAVLADGQTSSIAQTLAGAPANIALQLSATPQAGFGYYSAYVGVFRDLVRMLGAFQSAQLQFIPALNVQRGPDTALLLNTVPSFRKPQSVLVAVLPPVAPPTLPPLEARDVGALCLARPGLVLPVHGAPLAFSTDYARDLRLRVGTRELPVRADPARGGFVVTGEAAVTAGGAATEGVLHGTWGFAPFEGPKFTLAAPGGAWSAGDATLVAGRDTPLTLAGGSAGCVAEVRLERGPLTRAVPFEVDPDGRLALKVPLGDLKPGPLALSIRSHGLAAPQRLELRAFAEAGRIDGFTLHEGDEEGVLTGTRLDQIAAVEVAGTRFRPGALTRAGSTDRLALVAEPGTGAEPLRTGRSVAARATMTDGRNLSVTATVLPARPVATVLGLSSTPPVTQPVPVVLEGERLIRQDAPATFSLRAAPGTTFRPGDAVEVKAAAGSVRLPLRLQDDSVAVAVLDPAALGESAHGPLDYRIVRGAVAGDWQRLATLVRLPRLTALACDAGTCTLGGSGLFLLRSVGSVTVPDGFTGATLTFPREGTRATLALRDNGATATIALP